MESGFYRLKNFVSAQIPGIFMKFSFQLLFDWLENIPLLHSLTDPKVFFSRLSLLPDRESALPLDCLYVCGAERACALSSDHPDNYFICPGSPDPAGMELQEALRSSFPDSAYGNILLADCDLSVKELYLLLNEHYFTVSSWYGNMQKLILGSASLQELITLSESVIGNTINISDSAFTLLASTYGIETDNEITLLLRQYGYHPETTLNLMRMHDRFSIYESAGNEIIVFKGGDDFGPYDSVNRIFRFQNIYFTHAVMVCDHKPLTPGLLELFEMLNENLAILMKQEWDKRSSEANNSELFIKNIIEENLTDVNEIERRSVYFGLTAGDNYVLTAVTTENDIGVYKTRFIRELSELLPSSRIMLYQDLFLILSPVRKGHETPEEMSSFHLERFLKRNLASGGSSGVFAGLQFLPLAYRRAALALKYAPSNCRGRAFIAPPNEPEPPVITSYSDCFSRSVIGESPDAELLWRSSRFGKALLTLYQHDADHHNNNLSLLYAYLLSGMSASHTAALFHMHRNNVPYRIGRISSILDMDVTQEKIRLDLFTSFILFDIYGP